MGLSNTIAGLVQTKSATVVGIRKAYAKHPDHISPAPAVVMMPPRIRLTNGQWETLNYAFPMRIYVERTADDERTQTTLLDLVDLFIAEFRTGITLSSNITQCLVRDIETDRYYTVGETTFQAAEFTLEVLNVTGQTYTA